MTLYTRAVAIVAIAWAVFAPLLVIDQELRSEDERRLRALLTLWAKDDGRHIDRTVAIAEVRECVGRLETLRQHEVRVLYVSCGLLGVVGYILWLASSRPKPTGADAAKIAAVK